VTIPTVLIVDDEDYVADMIAATLKLEGYNVDVAYNGQEGLLRAQQQPFHLIIADVMMPYVSGPDMVRELRAKERTRKTPVLLISVGPRPQLDSSAITFLRKPFDIDAMLAVVRGAIQQQEFQT
jgi:DNA-binding response OmpR family regulator